MESLKNQVKDLEVQIEQLTSSASDMQHKLLAREKTLCEFTAKELTSTSNMQNLHIQNDGEYSIIFLKYISI